MEIPRGNTFGATAFLSYGAFWWSFALFVLFLHGTVPAAFIGWYLFLWGGFTLYMWVATWRAPRALQLVCSGQVISDRQIGFFAVGFAS
jgi:succinate-acetate transporter protein